MSRKATIIATATLVLAAPGCCWATSLQAGTFPWDTTLEALASYLTGPATHTLAWLAFGAAVVGYVIFGEAGPGVRQVVRIGVGITVALHAVQIMNFLFG